MTTAAWKGRFLLREDLGSLRTHRLELVRVKAEQGHDGWRDLSGLDERGVPTPMPAGGGDQDRHVQILEVVPTV